MIVNVTNSMKKIDVKARKLKIIDDNALELEINFTDDREFAKSLEGLGWKWIEEPDPLGADNGFMTIRKKNYPISEEIRIEAVNGCGFRFNNQSDNILENRLVKPAAVI
jgi:hypothetical protein